MNITFNEQFQKGVELQKRNQHDEALSVFKTLTSQNPLSASNWLNYGTLLFQNQQIKQAQLAFNEILKIDNFNYMAYYNLFLCYYFLKDHQTALKNIKLSLCLLCYHRGKKMQKIQLLNQSIKICHDNVLAYVARALLTQKEEKLDLSKEDLTTAIKLRQSHPFPYIERAQFYWRNDQVKQAQKDVKKYYQFKKNGQYGSLLPQILLQPLTTEEIMKKITQLCAQFQKIYLEGKDSIQQLERKQIAQSSDLFQNSAKNISREIQKLQGQIREERGSGFENESGSFQEDTFFSAEIDKLAQEIEKQKKTIRQTQLSDNSSFSSKFTETKLIDENLFKSYSKFKIQIVSAQIFQSDDVKGYSDGQVRLQYNKKKSQTQHAKDNTWNKKFNYDISHSEEGIDLELEMKKGNSLWSSKKIIGRGRINLLEIGQTKCIISNQEMKTGIIYYKLKLSKA